MGRKTKAVLRPDEKKKTTKKTANAGIMGTLLRAFLVPIVLIIVLGLVSYKTASNVIKEKVEDSSISTASAMSMYCGLLTGNVSSKALEMVVGDELSTYYEKYYKQKNAIEYLQSAKKIFSKCSLVWTICTAVQLFRKTELILLP